MVIGIDFDNTIASYDELMHRLAVDWGWIPATLPRNKRLVRDALRSLPDGELKWRRLQTHCYGPGMCDARPMEGIKEFLAACKGRGIPVRVVSHKSEFANFGDPTVNLRAAALEWMSQQSFFDAEHVGIGRDQVYFEETREDKIARIRSLGITHFIDDLEETFLERSFPPQVAKILFAPQPVHNGRGEWRSFASWPDIQLHLLGEQAPREDLEALAALLGRPVDAAERVGAGRNSRVYRVRCGGAEYAAKFYFKPTADGRDRLQVEFSALQFLWRRGVRRVAQPLRADAGRQVALYQFIDGEAVEASKATAADIDRLVEFIGQLKAIDADSEARSLVAAAEASFTIAGVVENVRQRLERLQSLKAEGAAYDALGHFLRDEFSPALQTLAQRAMSGRSGELAWQYRTLSPSDLGFHNTLRGGDGRLVFLDFEYFGWDDPAKTLSDALLHPLMRLSSERKRQLASGFTAVFGGDPGWRQRVDRLYPLFALKWCMIMLNEFRPEQIERRRYVDRDAEEAQVIQMRQLAAARSALQRIMREERGFPYWGQGE